MADVRPESLKRITTKAQADQFIDEQIKAIKEQVGDKKVLLALSGGVDHFSSRSPPYQGYRHKSRLCSRKPRTSPQGRA